MNLNLYKKVLPITLNLHSSNFPEKPPTSLQSRLNSIYFQVTFKVVFYKHGPRMKLNVWLIISTHTYSSILQLILVSFIKLKFQFLFKFDFLKQLTYKICYILLLTNNYLSVNLDHKPCSVKGYK